MVGTAKRIGKTAVSAHAARLLSSDRRVVVVAMGRGGPEVPEVVDGAAARVGVADLLARSRAGAHAASDYLEDAALAGVVTVGARRCGCGLAGRPFLSNVDEAVAAARALEPDLVLLEGSGAALPPVGGRPHSAGNVSRSSCGEPGDRDGTVPDTRIRHAGRDDV